MVTNTTIFFKRVLYILKKSQNSQSTTCVYQAAPMWCLDSYVMKFGFIGSCGPPVRVFHVQSMGDTVSLAPENLAYA